MKYQQQINVHLIIINCWIVDEYKVICIQGMLTASAINLAYTLRLDIAKLINIPSLKKLGLLLMDMDSTAIEIECINEIAKLIGIGNEMDKITKCAMLGEISLVRSLYKRLAMLKGVDINILKYVLDKLPLTPGLIQLVKKLQKLNWHVAIISSGFKYYASYLGNKLNLTDVIANELEIHNGKLTGKIIGPIVDDLYKLNSLKKISQRLNIPLEQTVAVGNGANDLLMIKSAGLGITYRANYKVNNQVSIKIVNSDLMGIFCILNSTIILAIFDIKK
nr:phosphoserine phosphatase SerB [Candidatus Pantoea edessiphila]